MSMKTRVTELLGIEVPVVQGAMARIADANLAGAVSEAGGLGIIACGGAPLDWVEEQVRIARSITDKPIGANVMLMDPNAGETAELLAKLRVDVITTGAGSPANYMQLWKDAGIKVVPVVASSALAARMERLGADAVVAEGTEAGGHIGELTTMALIPAVCDAVSIPVIAAGGIADGRGMAAAFALGAEGVQAGTRFLTARHGGRGYRRHGEGGGSARRTRSVRDGRRERPPRARDLGGSPMIEPIPAGAPVFMFSGQGAQKPGMGADLLDIPEVKGTFSCASDVLGCDVADLVLNADPDELDDTRNAQPALCVLSVGIARALVARGVQPAAVLGFSLGQVSALAVSGMLSDEATFALVKVRSELMAEAAAAHPGVMSALLKAEAGKRSSRLATSGAFHSPLMADAAAGLAAYLENVEFSEARIPLVCNVTAAPLSAADARENLVRHLTSPVRFDASVAALTAAGADMFVEVGFGGVLANLVKRIDKTATRACVQDRASFDGCLAVASATDSE